VTRAKLQIIFEVTKERGEIFRKGLAFQSDGTGSLATYNPTTPAPPPLLIEGGD